MTTTSAVPAVTDYLVTTAPAFLPAGTTVFDGPQPSKATLAIENIMWIGHNRIDEHDPSAEGAQDWPVLDHGRTKDEDASIVCTARHWSGDPRFKVHRDGAAALMAAVEIMLRGDVNSAGPGDASMGGLVLWSGVNGAFQWHQGQITGGAEALVSFRIIYRARLVTT